MIKFHKILEKNLKDTAPDNENIYFTETGRMLITDKEGNIKPLGYLSLATGGIVEGHAQFKRGLATEGEIISKSATTAFLMQNGAGLFVKDTVGNSCLLLNMDRNDCFQIGDGSHVIGMDGWVAPSKDKLYNLGTPGLYWNEGYVWSLHAGQITTPDFRSDQGAHRFDGHIEPFKSGTWQNLGQPDRPFGDVFCKRGAFNGSDIQLKENIKPIQDKSEKEKQTKEEIQEVVTTRSSQCSVLGSEEMEALKSNEESSANQPETSEVTTEDFYKYVKDASIYTFNYKQTEDNVVGIIANDIPENIFSKIGTYAEVPAPKALIDEEGDEPKTTKLRMINGPSQIAMLQGALKAAIQKIEDLEKRVTALESKNEGSIN